MKRTAEKLGGESNIFLFSMIGINVFAPVAISCSYKMYAYLGKRFRSADRNSMLHFTSYIKLAGQTGLFVLRYMPVSSS